MEDIQSKSTDWYTNLKNELHGEQMISLREKFSSCTTESAKVQLLYDLPQINTIMKVVARKKTKSSEKCISFREEGNKMFQKKHFKKALELYNSSVRAAPESGDTPLLALALANRSAALLYLKQYQLCLNDVQMAFETGYPENLCYKLMEREGKCYHHLKMKDQAKAAFEHAMAGLDASDLPDNKKVDFAASLEKQIQQCEKLSNTRSNGDMKVRVLGHGPIPQVKNKSSPTIPVLTDNAEISFSETSGRGLIAKQDILVGDVVVVEKPYTSTVLPGFAGSHCHHCCKRVIAPTPCLKCSGVVFCEENCRKLSWDGYHKFECGILESVRDVDISLGHLALKMVLTAGFELVEGLEKNIGVHKDDPKNAGFNEDGVYDSRDYRTVYDLVNHMENRNTDDVLKYCLNAVYLLKCLEHTKYFSSSETPISQKVMIGGHILRHLQMLPCNAHEVSELGAKYSNLPESVTLEIGSAIYPVLSLINHSCDPNVVRHSYSDTCVVRAIRNIPKGSEILDNYGVLCALTSCEERRKKMAAQYFFTCNCLACTDDYPLYTELPTDVPVFKCDQCSGPVFLPFQDSPPISVPCSMCKLCHDLTMRTGSLGQSDEKFRISMMEVLTNEKVDVNKHIPTLENHLQLMDSLILRPWRDYNDCQEVLKQCYALNASHFTVAK